MLSCLLLQDLSYGVNRREKYIEAVKWKQLACLIFQSPEEDSSRSTERRIVSTTATHQRLNKSKNKVSLHHDIP